MSFRRPSRSPLARSIARLLIAALLVAFLPADASASLPRPTSTLFEELPDRTFPVQLDPEAQTAVVVVLAGLEDGAWLVLLLPATALCGVGCGAVDPHFPIKYHRARWMDPRVGRFAGMDPWEGSLLTPTTLHRYLYAAAAPVANIDPTGLDSNVPSALTTITIGVQVAISNFGTQLSYAFQRGGPAIGQLFNRLGTWGNLVARNVLVQYQRLTPGFRFVSEVRVGQRVLDYGLRFGNRVATLETQFGLPWKRGPALTRLVEQMRESVMSGTRTVLFAVKEPSVRQINLLKRELGPIYDQIERVYGVEALWRWLNSFFGPT